MKTLVRLARRLVSAFAATTLASCAVVDKYSGRAVVYNIEAEQAQDQGLLLNIVRAYLRRPMQFTTVSSITGTATATGSLQYTAPVNVPFRPGTNGSSIATFPPLNTWTGGGSLSGGPTFTIPVLDTQEFYNGILKPIPAQLWNLYTQQGYSQDLLVNLFVEKIVMRRARTDCAASDHDIGCEIVLQNYVGDDMDIELFQLFSDYLLRLGLATEQEKDDPLLRPDKWECDDQGKIGAALDKVRAVLDKTPIAQRNAGWKKKMNEWNGKKNEWNRKRDECAQTRIYSAVNVNLKLSGSLGGLSSGGGASGSGAGGTTSSGGDSAPGKFSLCFATPNKQEAHCVYPRSKCGLKPSEADTLADEDELSKSAKTCKGSANSSEMSISEVHSDYSAESAILLKDALISQNEVSDSGTGTPKLSAAVFLQTRIAKMMKERLAALAPREIDPSRECSPAESKGMKTGEIAKSLATKRQQVQKAELPTDFRGLYCAIDKFGNNWIQVDFRLRSTEGLIYYLGETARRQLNPDFHNKQRYIYFNYPRHHLEYEVGRCINPKLQEPECRPIFVLQSGAGSALQNSFLSTIYDGEVYSVPSGEDSYSTQVLDILKQALALSSSSKSLPQANVVSVVGGQ